jgi:hypothetical protein
MANRDKTPRGKSRRKETKTAECSQPEVVAEEFTGTNCPFYKTKTGFVYLVVIFENWKAVLSMR